MTKKLVIVFDTDLSRRFTLTINNPKEDLTEATLVAEAERLIELGVLAPMQGRPVSVHSAKIVEQNVTEII
ncbi:DUF2922 domain-containing protein [Salinicoccus hispanicus]|uniref:DUF2922 family protein n=1 Tax=Salinicoccus hispanicus TaxID=157225 RepID=A0A6N8TVM0_9STAP|nr:DUF2922 domain-containing protein [Salinicoccus hispanicus]MXQ49954.1 DUF2922 family protein [Salinicoccus hispanicus]